MLCNASDAFKILTYSELCLFRYIQVYSSVLKHVNPFSTNGPLLYPLKTSENYLFRKYRSGTLVENGLSIIKNIYANSGIIKTRLSLFRHIQQPV